MARKKEKAKSKICKERTFFVLCPIYFSVWAMTKNGRNKTFTANSGPTLFANLFVTQLKQYCEKF